MDSSSDQRQSFGQAMTVAMETRGFTKAQLADKVGVTENAVWSWQAAKREPDRNMVFALEEALGREPGELSRLLGYLPVGARNPRTVLDAIAADAGLDARAKDILRAAYLAALPKRRRRN